MESKKHIMQKENKMIYAAFLLISLPIIYNTVAIFAYTTFHYSINDYSTFYDVVRYTTSLMAPLAYFLLSLAASNRAIRNILKITAAAVLLTNSAWLYKVNNGNTAFNLINIFQSASYLIKTLVICYLWGSVRRNYILQERQITKINSYIIGIYVILPIFLDSTALLYNKDKEIFWAIQTAIVNITEIILLYMIITPNIFCAESADIPTKEQYRFWNKYHLWWFIGVVLMTLVSLLTEALLL